MQAGFVKLLKKGERAMFTQVFDTHSHYTDTAFDSDRDTVLQRLPEQGIVHAVLAGTTVEASAQGIRLAEQYRQLGITEQYLKIQDEIERIIRYKDIKLTTASPVKMSNPEDGQNEKETESGTFADDLWFIVRGKDRKTSEKLLEYWHFICENSEWKCIERKKKG